MLTRTLAVLHKETREILRDPYTLGIALALPLMLLILFGYALNMDVKNIPMVVLDLDQTDASRAYTRAFVNSNYFRLVDTARDYNQVADFLDRDTADMALVIPAGFSRDLSAGKQAQAQSILNGSYPPSAQVTSSYITAITAAYNHHLLTDFLAARTGQALDQSIALTINTRVRYNPALKSSNAIVPGLFGVILMAVPPLLSALAIVREKERGSIQQVFVSPIRPAEFMIGKLIPYGVIAFLEMLLVLAAGVGLFGIPFRGSLVLFLAAAVLYVACTVAIGLLVSTLVRTQVAAMLLILVLTIMPSMLFSGFIFPIHTMPSPMQAYASTFPTRYFIDLSRAITLKGQGLAAVGPAMGILAAYAASLIALAAWRFKKRIG